MNYLLIFILLAISFLLGSIPTAYLVVKAVTGKDLRKVGSGNIGGTNAKRAADTKAQASIIYASTAIGDILKGTIPVFIAIQFTKSVDNQISRDLVRLAAAVLAVIGHDTMPFFRGGKGKGVATTAGAFLLLAPIPVLLGAASFFTLLLLTPVASRRSIISGMVIVVTCFIVNVSIVIKIGSIIAICLLLIRHKENIDRMIKGKE